MDSKKHSSKRVSSEDKQAEHDHKSIFSSIIPSSSPAQDIPAQQQSILALSEPKVDMTALEAKIDAMEKNILLRLEKNISEQLAEALKLFQPAKSDNSKALLLSRIAEMENKMVDFQKKTLLPLISKKDDIMGIMQKMEIMEKNILPWLKKNINEQLSITFKSLWPASKCQDSENLLINKMGEIENKLNYFQKKNEEFIKTMEKERLEASKKQALKDEIIEEKIKELLNDRLDGIERIFSGSIKEISDKFARSLEAFCGKIEGFFFKMFGDIKNKFYGDIADIKKQLTNDRREEFKALLCATSNNASEIKTDLQATIKKQFNDERESFGKDMKVISLEFAKEYKKLDEMQNAASNNASKIKADLQAAIKKHFDDEGELFRKDMNAVSIKFVEEYKKLDEMRSATLNNVSKIKTDLRAAIKKHFDDERELFRKDKDMEAISFKFAKEYKKLDEMQDTALEGNAPEIKTDLQALIKKHFSRESELFTKETADIVYKLNEEYKKINEIHNTVLGNINAVDGKIEGFLKKMETVIADGENSLLNKADIENKKHLLKMKEFCAKTSQEMFSSETISYYLDTFHSKAFRVGKNLESIVKEIDNLRFEPILGSTGITIKREFESLRSGLLELRNETEAFNNLRTKIGQLVVKLSETDGKHSNQ